MCCGRIINGLYNIDAVSCALESYLSYDGIIGASMLMRDIESLRMTFYQRCCASMLLRRYMPKSFRRMLVLCYDGRVYSEVISLMNMWMTFSGCWNMKYYSIRNMLNEEFGSKFVSDFENDRDRYDAKAVIVCSDDVTDYVIDDVDCVVCIGSSDSISSDIERMCSWSDRYDERTVIRLCSKPSEFDDVDGYDPVDGIDDVSGIIYSISSRIKGMLDKVSVVI